MNVICILCIAKMYCFCFNQWRKQLNCIHFVSVIKRHQASSTTIHVSFSQSHYNIVQFMNLYPTVYSQIVSFIYIYLYELMGYDPNQIILVLEKIIILNLCSAKMFLLWHFILSFNSFLLLILPFFNKIRRTTQ